MKRICLDLDDVTFEAVTKAAANEQRQLKVWILRRLLGDSSTAATRQPGLVGQRPGTDPPVVGQRPGTDPPVVGQRPGTDPPVVGQRPGTDPPVVGQRPGTDPPVVGQRPGTDPPVVGQRPGTDPPVVGQRPGTAQVEESSGASQEGVTPGGSNPQRRGLTPGKSLLAHIRKDPDPANPVPTRNVFKDIAAREAANPTPPLPVEEASPLANIMGKPPGEPRPSTFKEPDLFED